MTWKVFKLESEYTIAPAYLGDVTEEDIVRGLLRNAKIREFVHIQKHYRDDVRIEEREQITVNEFLDGARLVIVNPI